MTGIPACSRRAARRVIGAAPKAARLAAAARAGLPVPDAVVVPDGDPVDAARLASLAARFGARRVAVRSAFAAEDGAGASLAGAYRSLLGVDATDPRALAAAIEAVRRSALRPGVPRPVRADVLVQVQVPARYAGVAFSEPDFEDDLVEYCTGTADRLVAGAVAGTRVELARVRAGEAPSVPATATAAELELLARLARLLRRVRRTVGDRPLDLEWADDGARCWLVQIRPIVASPGRDEAFTVANHKEILPELPSRTMAGILAERSADLYGWYRRRDPRLPAGRPFLEVFHGRPRINLSLLLDTVRRWGLDTRLVTRSIGGGELAVRATAPLRLLASWRALARLALVQARPRAAARTAQRRIAATVATIDLASLTGTVDALGRVYVDLVHGMFALTAAMSGPLALLRRLGVRDGIGARTVTTELLLDLQRARHRLAGTAAASRAALAGGRSPDDPAARAVVAEFLSRHGHRGVFESDIARPRFAEDPAPLLRALAALPDGARDAGAPAAPRAPWWAWPLVRAAARPTAAREQLRSEAMRAFARIRRRLLAHADALVAAGRLPDRDAIFELSPAELRAFDTDPSRVWSAADREVRRADIAAERALRLPDLFRRRELGRIVADGGEASLPMDGPIASGLGLGRGRAEGVVWRADDPLATPPADGRPRVLVAPAIDAGWIPAISVAVAVVVETGGELSHGSIVLREAGIPAVTNVPGAMRRWRDGERVRVDALLGRVERVP